MNPMPVLAAACAFAVSLTGCASQQRLRQDELAALVAALPGTYDNVTQAREDAAAGNTAPRAALRLTITPLYAPLVGKHVFHVRETTVGEVPRLVLQRVWTLSIDPQQRIVQQLLALNSPERWRSGDPELFRSLLPQDLRVLGGCDLVWERSGEGFKATNRRETCRADASAADEPRTIEYRAEVNPDSLALAERQFDAAGRVVLGDAADPFYRFIRRGR